jgi:hypothetical protein
MLEVEKSDALTISHGVLKLLKDYGVPLKNFIAPMTDSCNTMTGNLRKFAISFNHRIICFHA